MRSQTTYRHPQADLSVHLDEARRTAELAAEQAGVRVVEVADAAGLARVAAFFTDLWQAPPHNPPLPGDVLRSLCHAGGAAQVAFDAGDRVVGAAAAVFSPPEEHAVYSMVAAAATGDRGVGFAVKQAQRVWALQRGATTMSWTFDPLIGRNARFNLAKLGAVGVEYLVDFYGPMDDGFNGGDESDRLTARWNLLAAGRPVAPVPRPDNARDTRRAPDGGPLAVRTDEVIWCRIPADVLALRRDDPTQALAWRRAVREVFLAAFADGFAATGISRDGWYQLTHRETA